jgi:hypothetical protein
MISAVSDFSELESKILKSLPLLLLLPLSCLAGVDESSDRRMACDSFAELAGTVIQIRQQVTAAEDVLEYADKNLKGEYPPFVFGLVSQMIKDAFARPVANKEVLATEAKEFINEQRWSCNQQYAHTVNTYGGD